MRAATSRSSGSISRNWTADWVAIDIRSPRLTPGPASPRAAIDATDVVVVSMRSIDARPPPTARVPCRRPDGVLLGGRAGAGLRPVGDVAPRRRTRAGVRADARQ